MERIRLRRWAEERIVPEMLEGESPEEPGDTVLRMLRAVVDGHSSEEDYHVSHNEHRNQPRRPLRRQLVVIAKFRVHQRWYHRPRRWS